MLQFYQTVGFASVQRGAVTHERNPAFSSNPLVAQVTPYRLALPLFLSGASALIAELCWLRSLSITIGGSSTALNILLITFMGGLGIGARVSRRIRVGQAVFVYGCLEILLAAYIILSPRLLHYLDQLYVPFFASIPFESVTEQALRFLSAGIILLPPTILMGMTTPLLITAAAEGSGNIGYPSGFLYGVNTAGGSVGALLAGCYLVLHFGVSKTLWIAGCLNLIAGILVLFTFPQSKLRKHKEITATEEKSITRTGIHVPWISALSGFTGMALEICFARLALFTIGGSYFSHTIVISGFLFGLVVGSLIAAAILRRRTANTGDISRLFFFLGATTLLATFLFPFIPNALQNSLVETNVYKLPPYIIKFCAAFLVTVLPAAASGMILPFLVDLDFRSTGSAQNSSSIIFAMNTIGAVLGIGFTGFLLIQTFGLINTTLFLSLSLFVYSIIASVADQRKFRFLSFAGVCISVLFVIRLGSVAPFVYGVFYKKLGSPNVLFHKDDSHTSVAIIQEKTKRWTSLTTNGLTEATIDVKEPPTDTGWLSDVTILSHFDPHTLFVAGLGAGRTAGVAGLYPGIKVTVVEISSAVMEAFPHFDPFTYNASSNPQIRVIRGDARHFLQNPERRFDLINTDVFISALTGTSYLYNVEYFSLCSSRLNPGGRLVVVANLNDRIDRVIARSFAEGVPYVAVVPVPNLKTAYLIGSNEPIRFPRLSELKWNMDARLQKRMNRIGITQEGLNSFSIYGKEELLQRLKGIPPSTDDHPIVDFVGFFTPRDTALMW